ICKKASFTTKTLRHRDRTMRNPRLLLSSTFRNFSDEVFHLYTRLFHVVGISRSRSNAGTCINPRANPSIDSVARRATTCCHQGHLSGGGLPIPPRKLRKVELRVSAISEQN